MSLLNLFHRISFPKIDPLGAGLREEIAVEQEDPSAMTLEEGIDEGELSEFWQQVEADIEQDPEWFKFSE
jgi:hypothetical protein